MSLRLGKVSRGQILKTLINLTKGVELDLVNTGEPCALQLLLKVLS